MGGTELISRSHQATELFAPNDVMTTSLEDVQPVFSAMFEIDTAAAEGLLRLEVEFSKVTASGDSEIARKRWIRLDGPNVESGSRGASPPLDLNVVALEGYVPVAMYTSSHSSEYIIGVLRGRYRLLLITALMRQRWRHKRRSS